MSAVLKFVILLFTILTWVNSAPDYDVKEIMEWKVPEHLQKKFPYYLSGYDYDGSPEFGKWDVRGEIEAGPEATEQLDMLITQAFVHWRQAGVETPGSPGSLVIVDLDGFSVRQAGHFGDVLSNIYQRMPLSVVTTFFGQWPPAQTSHIIHIMLTSNDPHDNPFMQVVQFLLRQFSKFEKIAREPGLKKIMGINVNYLVERIFEAGRPLLGQVADIFELHGSPATWKPLLLNEVPADQLPAWYGGSMSHEVIKVFGG